MAAQTHLLGPYSMLAACVLTVHRASHLRDLYRCPFHCGFLPHLGLEWEGKVCSCELDFLCLQAILFPQTLQKLSVSRLKHT